LVRKKKHLPQCNVSKEERRGAKRGLFSRAPTTDSAPRQTHVSRSPMWLCFARDLASFWTSAKRAESFGHLSGEHLCAVSHARGQLHTTVAMCSSTSWPTLVPGGELAEATRSARPDSWDRLSAIHYTVCTLFANNNRQPRGIGVGAVVASCG
jgi:hypothetical protein